jgi:hypothetical protein
MYVETIRLKIDSSTRAANSGSPPPSGVVEIGWNLPCGVVQLFEGDILYNDGIRGFQTLSFPKTELELIQEELDELFPSTICVNEGVSYLLRRDEEKLYKQINRLITLYNFLCFITGDKNVKEKIMDN